MNLEEYNSLIKKKLAELFEVAKRARQTGKDITLDVDVMIGSDFATRIEQTVGPPGVGKVIQELLAKGLSREEIAIKVSDMICEGKLGSELSREKKVEQCIKTGVAIITSAVVAGPIAGVEWVRPLENEDGTVCAQVCFAGPARSAGGTAMAMMVVIGAYAARKLGFAPYKPSTAHLGRFIEEALLYEQRQYTVPKEVLVKEVEIVVKNAYIAITGGPGASKESNLVVATYKNVPGIDDHAMNFVRDPAMLVIQEGLLLKSAKILQIVKKLGLEGWDWLESVGKSLVTEEGGHSDTYLSRLLGGRAVICLHNTPGGLALRYGRTRTGGLYCFAIHPSATYILGKYLTIGGQVVTSYPSKGGTIQVCDELTPPFVRLKNGDCKYVHDHAEAERLVAENAIDKVLFAGEILISPGDVMEAGNVLLPSAWVPEWYAQYVARELERGAQTTVDKEIIDRIISDKNFAPPPEVAFKLSRELNIPLHPRYCYVYAWTSVEKLKQLHLAVRQAEGCALPVSVKEVLEDILVPHVCKGDYLELSEDDMKALKLTFNTDSIPETDDPLEYVNMVAGVTILHRYPTIIGCRAGRPVNPPHEWRGMKGHPHVLFPVGKEGGIRRLLKNAVEAEKITIQAATFRCVKCGDITISPWCRKCARRCEVWETNVRIPDFPIKQYAKEVFDSLGEDMDKVLVKGVAGLSSRDKFVQPLEKGILRAKYGLETFKDGTIRKDLTHQPLTAFRPCEIGLTVEKARELGYTTDIYGNPLVSDTQLVHLFPQDLIIPEQTAQLFVNCSKYVDELLTKFYGLEPFYRAEKPEDLVGHLFFTLSPHTYTMVPLRLIGFTKNYVQYNHPLAISMRRRDADGDSDAVILALELLLDFQECFIPPGSGRLLDAPIITIDTIRFEEVDKQAYGVDTVSTLPLEFYEATLRCEHSSRWRDKIQHIGVREGEARFIGYGFTHDTKDINCGAKVSAYVEPLPDGTSKSMMQKIDEEWGWMCRSRGIPNPAETLKLLITTHLVSDYKGNMRAYSGQLVRCTACNAKFRRMPLSGKCTCGKPLVQTVSEGAVRKYLKLMQLNAERTGDPTLLDEVKEFLMEVELFFRKPQQTNAVQTTLDTFGVTGESDEELEEDGGVNDERAD